MSKLYLMVGIPGSGKSTFIKECLKTNPNAICISRDAIRFDIVAEDEEYFSKEIEVFDIFCKKINDALKQDKEVFVDATHITRGSRRKTFDRLEVNPEKVICIFFDTPLEIALERNENRKGTRAYVPRGVIRRMYAQLEKPAYDERWCFDSILIAASKEGEKNNEQ